MRSKKLHQHFVVFICMGHEWYIRIVVFRSFTGGLTYTFIILTHYSRIVFNSDVVSGDHFLEPNKVYYKVSDMLMYLWMQHFKCSIITYIRCSKIPFVSSGLILPPVILVLCTVFHISKTKAHYVGIRFSKDVIMFH